MSAFRALAEISCDFENDLRRASAELFSAKAIAPTEDILAKKMQDLCIFASKYKLLQAKTLAMTPQVKEQEKNEELTMGAYGDAATWAIIEQQATKTIMQAHVVRKVLRTPDNKLHPEIVETKKKVIDILDKHREAESDLHDLESILKEREMKLLEAREKWDETCNKLRERKQTPQNAEVTTGPLYKKLQDLVDKMELMRWLITKLVTARTDDYDWISDPHDRLKALTMARQRHSIENYTEM
ncbi:uncharacterized protein LOC121736391 [Aricia agestis]|uniref:uncharacterized protein LOC121736391 n=1 Tax=Aricia agestis TaxID=91739 RepID=UPI001C204BBD|nr:uncharacterized protein LOC121736391 [Aricia agestis]